MIEKKEWIFKIKNFRYLLVLDIFWYYTLKTVYINVTNVFNITYSNVNITISIAAIEKPYTKEIL